MSDEPIEHELLRQAVCVLEPCVPEAETEHFMENTRVRITVQADPDILESCALGVIYALGMLSFHDARPRGNSGAYYAARDEWTAADMVGRVRFSRGHLHFYADYVRGRMMKTDVEIFPDGRIVLETTNRGEAATRWVERLQGKAILALVEGETPKP